MLRFISLFVLSEHCVQDGQQARMWRILVEQITSVCPLTSSGREIVISDIIVFPFGL